jgi:hypothetical protein
MSGASRRKAANGRVKDLPGRTNKTALARAKLAADWSAARSVLATNLVRDYVRTEMLPDVLDRMYSIGMGVEQFKHATMFGDIYEMPASAQVQVAALGRLLGIAVPSKLGLVDTTPKLPGIFVFPEAEMNQARQLAGQDEYAILPGNGNGSVARLSPDVERAVAAGDMEVVEVDENGTAAISNDQAPGPVVRSPRLEDEFLKQFRERKRNGNGKRRS